MDIARNILNKFLDPRIKRTKTRKSTLSCLEDLSKYINLLCAREIRKTYSVSHVVGAVFKDKRAFKNQNEIEQYCKCQIYLANEWLDFLIEKNIKVKGKASHKRILKFQEHISDFIHDVKPFIEYFERKQNPEYVFFYGSKYYGQPAWQIYRESCGLYWLSTQEKVTCQHRMAINMSIFGLRQALELKFQRIIGIYGVYSSNHEQAKVKHDYYANFIQKNLDKIKTKYSTISSLIKIYKWTNNTIHTGVIPYIWEQWYALEVCGPLFSFHEENEDGSWSIHGAVKLLDHDYLKNEFVKDFCKEYPSNTWCFEFHEPEAVIINA